MKVSINYLGELIEELAEGYLARWYDVHSRRSISDPDIAYPKVPDEEPIKYIPAKHIKWNKHCRKCFDVYSGNNQDNNLCQACTKELRKHLDYL